MGFKKIIILRFSSFGDIVQAMGALGPLKEKFPEAEIHWATKKEFAELVGLCPFVTKVHAYDSSTGLKGLFNFYSTLLTISPDLIYDAHTNVRSLIGKIFFKLKARIPFQLITRSKQRLKRLLLFSFRINTFRPWPCKGIMSFMIPLERVGVAPRTPPPQRWIFPAQSVQLFDRYPLLKQNFVAMAPGAAWPMKRWPIEHWKKLLEQWQHGPVVILGGPEDHYCEQLLKLAPQDSINLAGKITLLESSFIVAHCTQLICADTGLLHVADLLGVPALALIGPTAFGHPTLSQVRTLENPRPLPCRPCTKDGRGKCVRDIYQECMVGITPDLVQKNLIPKKSQESRNLAVN